MARRYVDLTWPELAVAVERGAGVILPVGAIEQHGPHLPLDTDSYLAEAFAIAAAARHDLVVCPMIPFGYRSRPLSGGGPGFPGTLSLSGATLVTVLGEIIRGLVGQGFRRLIVYSWHMENQNFVYEATWTALERCPDAKAVVLEAPFADLSAASMSALYGSDFPGWPAEHASILETSLMLYLCPERVRMERAVDDSVAFAPPYDVIPPRSDMTTKSGVMARASLGTVAKGEIAFAEIRDHLCRTVEFEFPELSATDEDAIG
jgi:creatinine amidohydrolase